MNPNSNPFPKLTRDEYIKRMNALTHEQWRLMNCMVMQTGKPEAFHMATDDGRHSVFVVCHSTETTALLLSALQSDANKTFEKNVKVIGHDELKSIVTRKPDNN